MFVRIAMMAMLALAGLLGPAVAAETGTPEEAKAMAFKAAAYAKEHGRDKAFEAFNAGIEGFKDRDLYVFVNNSDGEVIAHGANPKLIGKNTRGVKDVNGVALIEEMIKTASNGGEGWVEYSWPHPDTKKLAAKLSYVVGLDDYYVDVGAYK